MKVSKDKKVSLSSLDVPRSLWIKLGLASDVGL
jgi:hypothetical protein